jgi:surface antigen
LAEVCSNVRFSKMRFMIGRPAVVSVLFLSVLSGCTTNSRPSTPGGGLLSRPSVTSTPYIASLQGGIVARSGVTLERNDLQRALEAEYRALEGARGGQPVAWSGDEARGQVVAAAPYQVGNQNCRQYNHTLTSGGRETKVRGAACRNPDGTWTPLT